MKSLSFTFLISLGISSSWLFASGAEAVQGVIQKESVRLGEIKAQAKSYYKTGLTFYQNQEYSKARAYFNQALRLNPDHADARSHLSRVQSILGMKESYVGFQGEWIGKNLSVKRQEQRIELQRLLEKAEIALSKGHQEGSFKNHQGFRSRGVSSYQEKSRRSKLAKKYYEQALEVVKKMDSGQDQQSYQKLILSKIQDIDDDSLALKSQYEGLQQREAKKSLWAEAQKEVEYEKSKVESLLRVARKSFAQEKYNECFRLCHDILKLDRKNIEAKSLSNRALTLEHHQRENRTRFERNKELTRRHLKIKEASVPYTSNIVYPDNWKEKSHRKSKDIQVDSEPTWKRKLESQLDRYVSYSCPPDFPLSEVLGQLSALSGVNIVLSPKVLQERDEDELELKEFTFENMKLRNILYWVCRKMDLSFSLKYDVVYVEDKGVSSEKKHVQVYDVQDLLQRNKAWNAPELRDGFVKGEG